jgi:predicted transcriptional regulator
MKFMNIEIDSELHRRFKQTAAAQQQTMKAALVTLIRGYVDSFHSDSKKR